MVQLELCSYPTDRHIFHWTHKKLLPLGLVVLLFRLPSTLSRPRTLRQSRAVAMGLPWNSVGAPIVGEIE